MEELKDICADEVKNLKKGYFWKGFALFLLGVIIGFFISPVKKGLTVGCNCGNNYTGGQDEEDCFSEK